MTPKEKAAELINNFLCNMPNPNTTNAAVAIIVKQNALIAVDEILKATATEYQIQYDNGEWSREIGYKYSKYWLEVKQEIEKL